MIHQIQDHAIILDHRLALGGNVNGDRGVQFNDVINQLCDTFKLACAHAKVLGEKHEFLADSILERIRIKLWA